MSMARAETTGSIDLSRAALVCAAAGDRRVETACAVLIEELEARTGIRWPRVEACAEAPAAVVQVGTRSSLGEAAAAADGLATPGPEGFRLLAAATAAGARVVVAGSDARGVLYGVGRLLRALSLRRGRIALDAPLALSSTPRYALRGHQLGYRPLNNTYDAWTPQQFERYIRELALFGANAIEFVPPLTDDPQSFAPHMKLPALDMLVQCSGICDRYGLDVWLWYPNVGGDYATAAAVRSELSERETVFRAMPRLNALFIPGGDPGGLDIPTLFGWSEQVAALLRRRHPGAGLWLSTQAFKAERAWLDAFYAAAAREPDWLTGVVFAPWERDSPGTLRARIPARYPIRHYPDITHTYLCQYPVPRWDPAFAAVEGRECINPRPLAMKRIHNLACGHMAGSITYSEGVNDDVNKFVWQDQEWDPGKPVVETLREYVRFFMGPDEVDVLVAGLLALERNWEGPLAANAGAEETLALWRGVESRAPALSDNWRFQQGLLRACLDAAIRRRLLHESGVQQRAWEALAAADPAAALSEAERILEAGRAAEVAADLVSRCHELADGLWARIGAQLTTTRHHGQRTYRGAFMDSADAPLNDREWLMESFGRIRALPPHEQRRAIAELLRRADPGPGGCYDRFDEPASWARVEQGPGLAADPAGFETPILAYWAGPGARQHRNSLTAYYDTPVRVRYSGLDPFAGYLLRVAYVCGPWPYHVRLCANDRQVLEEALAVGKGDCLIREYLLERSLTAGGRLALAWTTHDGELGARIAEIWLIKCREDKSEQMGGPR